MKYAGNFSIKLCFVTVEGTGTTKFMSTLGKSRTAVHTIVVIGLQFVVFIADN